MIGIWRLFAFGLVVLVRYVGQEMEANHGQIRVLKEEDEAMKIWPPSEPPPCWKWVIRGRNTALEDWFQRLNKLILLKFIVPIFNLFSKKFVAIILLLVFDHGNKFFTLIEGSAKFDIVSGGWIGSIYSVIVALSPSGG
ncbi:unnamed protein product [Cuscuta europaea]|uniref:Uncharacterized protein n=1 Tax=Cuscuta europaea TaxID=41803 RepID=A0A9P0ZEA9_CUSEU|nr:unnamed protein product [Cuscuta europaea]